jgi:hypothetical protein
MVHRERWMVSILAMTGGLVGGILSPHIFQSSVTAGQIPHEIVAEKFVVQDKDGNRPATLDASGLGIADRKGNLRLSLGVLPNDGTPILLFLDQKQTRATLAAFADRTILEFNDANEKPQINLMAGPGGKKALRLFDRDGKVRGSVIVTEDGHAAPLLGDLVETDRGQAGFAHPRTKEGGR